MLQHIFFATLLLSLGCSLGLTPLHAADELGDGTCQSSAYTAYPPFVSTQSKPNVMFMLDNSGSMKGAIYGSTYNGGKSFGIFQGSTYKYDPTIPVDPGAFKNSKTGYAVTIRNSVKGTFIEEKCDVANDDNCWDANFLNWITTRRIDSARQVLAGGKVESKDGYTYLKDDADVIYYKIVGNNEPEDRVLSKKTHNNKENGVPKPQHSPIPANTAISIYSPAMHGAEMPSYDPYAKISTTTIVTKEDQEDLITDEEGNAKRLILDDEDKVIGEFGTISAIKGIRKVNFLKKSGYKKPRIILGSMQRSNRMVMYTSTTIKKATTLDDGTVLAAGTVLTDSFVVIPAVNWNKANNKPDATSTFYMILEEGTHTVNGQKIIAGSKNVDWPDYVPLDTNGVIFEHNPVIFASIASDNDFDAAVARIKDSTINGFNISLDRRKKPLSTNPEHAPSYQRQKEEVHYIALEDGLIPTGNGYTLKVERFPVNGSLQEFDLGNINHSAPEIIAAATQTSNESDPFAIRHQLTHNSNNRLSTVKLVLEEETSNGSNRVDHKTEMLAAIFAIKGEVTEYNIALVQRAKPAGLFADFKESVRQGASFYKFNFGTGNIYDGSSRDGGTSVIAIPSNPFVRAPQSFRYIDTPVGADVAVLSDAIQHMPLVWGTTPLAENFYEVIRYFQQKQPYYTKSSNSSDRPSHYVRTCASDADENCNNEWDPYYFNELKDYVWCANSNVIILTDGAPAKDANVPPFINPAG